MLKVFFRWSLERVELDVDHGRRRIKIVPEDSD